MTKQEEADRKRQQDHFIAQGIRSAKSYSAQRFPTLLYRRNYDMINWKDADPGFGKGKNTP